MLIIKRTKRLWMLTVLLLLQAITTKQRQRDVPQAFYLYAMMGPWPKHGMQQALSVNTRFHTQFRSFVKNCAVQHSTNVKTFSPFSASPGPGYFLNRKNDLNSDDEALFIHFDDVTDDEASLTSNRSPSCPFNEFEAEQTETSYQNDNDDYDDSDDTVWSSYKHKWPRN